MGTLASAAPLRLETIGDRDGVVIAALRRVRQTVSPTLWTLLGVLLGVALLGAALWVVGVTYHNARLREERCALLVENRLLRMPAPLREHVVRHADSCRTLASLE
jgi:hypothetical protein